MISHELLQTCVSEWKNQVKVEQQRWWTMDRVERQRFRRRRAQNRSRLLSRDLLSSHFATRHRLFMCLRKSDVFREQPQKRERTDSTRDIWRETKGNGIPLSLSSSSFYSLFRAQRRDKERRRGSSRNARGMKAKISQKELDDLFDEVRR